MDSFQVFFLTISFLLSVFNTFLLIGIARFLVKLVKYVGPEEKDERQQWAKIIRQRRVLQTQEGNSVTYADTAALQQTPERDASGPRGWDGIPRGKNWDGIPRTDE